MKQHSCKNAPPEEFICPLTLELMTNPVVNRQGNCYEKSALVKWLSLPNATCPLTRNPITLSDFIRDVKLQKKIMQWRINQGEDPDEVSQECTESSTAMDDFGVGFFVRVPSLIDPPIVTTGRRLIRRKPILQRWKAWFLWSNKV